MFPSMYGAAVVSVPATRRGTTRGPSRPAVRAGGNRSNERRRIRLTPATRCPVQDAVTGAAGGSRIARRPPMRPARRTGAVMGQRSPADRRAVRPSAIVRYATGTRHDTSVCRSQGWSQQVQPGAGAAPGCRRCAVRDRLHRAGSLDRCAPARPGGPRVSGVPGAAGSGRDVGAAAAASRHRDCSAGAAAPGLRRRGVRHRGCGRGDAASGPQHRGPGVGGLEPSVGRTGTSCSREPDRLPGSGEAPPSASSRGCQPRDASRPNGFRTSRKRNLRKSGSLV